jgi:hypothetical protein
MPIIKAKNIAGSDEVVAGANADTLDGLHASDFVLASEWNCNFKNKLMNGNLDIWQRTQPSTLTNALSYVADRFMSYPGAGGTATIARKTFDLGQTIVPDNPSYYYEHTQAATSTDPPWMLQWVEGVIHSSGKTMTLSFWAKADKAITANIEFRQTWDSSMGVNGWTNSSLTPVSLTTSWQKYQVTYTYPSLSGKTLGINNYYGFVIFLPASTTFTFDLANVQLEEGSIATSFEHRPIGLEVMMCQRYFERPVGRILGTMPTGYSGYLTWQYKVLKRTIPTVGKGSSSYTAVQTVDQGTLSVYQTSGSVITIEDNAYVDAELY